MNFLNGAIIPSGAGRFDPAREGHIGNFFFPRKDYVLAEQLGAQRAKAGAGSYANRIEKISDEQSREGHILGALGELAALQYCVVFDIPYRAPYIFARKPVRAPDFTLFGNYRVNVKAAPYLNGSAHLLVSRGSQHGNGEECDGYWFMAVTRQQGEVEHFHFTKKTVNQWPVKDFGYCKASYLPLEEIERRAK